MASPSVPKSKVLINVDLGEGYGNFTTAPDAALIPLIDQANIACGFHAGDPVKMAESIRLCRAHNVAIGAHPSLPDLLGFGRREMALTPEEHTANIIYQVGALSGFLADSPGEKLHHVKPHGSLYGMMSRDVTVCRAVMKGIAHFGAGDITVLGLAGGHHEAVATEMGLRFVAEVYADVEYRADGSLVIDRVKKPWAGGEEAMVGRVRRLVEHGEVGAVTGETVRVERGIGAGYPLSVCCHSDSPGCVEIVSAARRAVDEFNREHGLV